MFCPGCGIQVSDDLKFCKQCGVNLHGAREGMLARPTGEKFDWSKTWVAEMFLTEEERERRRGVTAEEKWLNEIKGGVITSFAGVGAMIFLKLFLEVVANQQDPSQAEIIRHVWLAGIVPFTVGIGIIFNGLFISRSIAKLKERRKREAMPATPPTTSFPAVNSNLSSISSVTEMTTAHLEQPENAAQTAKE